MLGGFCRALCSTPVPIKEEEYVRCTLQVDADKRGKRQVKKLLRCCQVGPFQMDPNGKVEISTITDQDKLLRVIMKSKRMKLIKIECSNKDEAPNDYVNQNHSVIPTTEEAPAEEDDDQPKAAA